MELLLGGTGSRKTIALRDKISFFCGVMNVLCCALLLGFNPTWSVPFLPPLVALLSYPP